MFCNFTASLVHRKTPLTHPWQGNLLNPILPLHMNLTEIVILIYDVLCNMKKPTSYNAVILGEKGRGERQSF